jgi:hypothetical protein
LGLWAPVLLDFNKFVEIAVPLGDAIGTFLNKIAIDIYYKL